MPTCTDDLVEFAVITSKCLITGSAAYEFRLSSPEGSDRQRRRVVVRVDGRFAREPAGEPVANDEAKISGEAEFTATDRSWSFLSSAMSAIEGMSLYLDGDADEIVEPLRHNLACLTDKQAADDLNRAELDDVLGGIESGVRDFLARAAGNADADDPPPSGWRTDWTRDVHRLTRAADVPPRPLRAITYDGWSTNTYDLSIVPKEYPSSHLLQRAALGFGLDTTRLSKSVFVATHPALREPLGFTNNMGAWTGSSAFSLTYDKRLTRNALQSAGVPVAVGAAFKPNQVEDAVAFANTIDGSVVVKPQAGSKGTGVSTDLRTEVDVRRSIAAIDDTPYAGGAFIVEKFVTGNDYRVHVVGDRVVSVVMRQPASVVGDGCFTVADLVLAKNRIRLQNPQMRKALIPLGHQAHYWLERQGLTASSVPADGQVVQLGSSANVTSGGDSIEVLDQTHPSLLELAVRAVQVFPGLDHAGVDLIGNHLSDAVHQETTILEVNGSPITALHHFPLFGPRRDVADELVLRGCELAEHVPGPQRHTLRLRIEVHGQVQGVGYRAWFARRAERLGVAGWIRNTPSRTAEAYVSGGRDQVAFLASTAIAGPASAAATCVTTTHVTSVDDTGDHTVSFDVR